MPQQPLDNTHIYSAHSPRSQIRAAFVWQGQDDEYGNRQAVNIDQYVVPLQTIYQRLNTTPEKLISFCKKWQIVELAAFGSILREDFRISSDDPSDVDLLYRLADSSDHSLFEVINMHEELENLCRRKVDFISKQGIQSSRNWLRRQEILASGMVLYVQK
jgi:hypothetical protein